MRSKEQDQVYYDKQQYTHTHAYATYFIHVYLPTFLYFVPKQNIIMLTMFFKTYAWSSD